MLNLPQFLILHTVVLCRRNCDLTEAVQKRKLFYRATYITKYQIANHLHDCRSICSYFGWC